MTRPKPAAQAESPAPSVLLRAVCEVCVLNDSTPGAAVGPFPTRHTARLHFGPMDELFETVPAERLVQARHWAGCCTLILS